MSNIAKAQLVIGSAEALPVQFNPASLQVEISNSVTPQSGDGSSQQVSTTSSAKLDLTLLFDTSGSGEDVRSKTRPIRACVRAPVTGDSEAASDASAAFVPPTVRFEWGTFLFIGVADNFRETLDFFSGDGVPLRAEVVLALKEQPERHTALERTNERTTAHSGAFDVPAGGPLPPRTVGNINGNNSGSGFGLSVRVGLGGAAGVAQQGGDLRAARAIATANGQDNLRFASGPSLGVAPGPAPRPAPSTAGGSGPAAAAVNSPPVSPLRFDARRLTRSSTAAPARQLATDAGAAFSVDGRALPQTDAGLRSDVGVNRSLAGRLRFEE